MKSFRRLLLPITIIFIVSIFAASVYAEPTDIKGHWANAEINRWIDRGILFGSYGKFNPDELISRAEFMAIINRVFQYRDQSAATVFSDIKGTEWYAKDIYTAAAEGILVGSGGKIRPNDPVSRQEAAVIITKVLGLEVKNRDAVNSFSDASSIPAWSRDAICAMVENGFAAAKTGNAFAPADKMTRAEAVKMMDSSISDLKNKPGTYSGTVDGNLVVNTSGVILESMTVNGNLYLTEGIGDGDVTLDKVTVKGKTIVTGGGEHSIVIRDSSLNGSLVVYKKDGKIRIAVSGSTDIPSVSMQSGGRLVEDGVSGNGFGGIQVLAVVAKGQSITLDGSFEDVSVEAPGVEIQVADGTIRSLRICENAAGSNVQIDKGAGVDVLTLDAAADIKGEGAVSTAKINANGVTIEQTPKEVVAKDGVTLPSNLQPQAGLSGGFAPPPAGGGEVLNVLSATAHVGGVPVAAVYRNGRWEADLSDFGDSAMFTDLTVTASPNVVSASVQYLLETKTVYFHDGSANINVSEMLGSNDSGHDGVSLSTIRKYGISTFSITLKGSSATTSVSIKLNV